MATYRHATRTGSSAAQGGNGRIRAAFTMIALGLSLHALWPDSAPEGEAAPANDNPQLSEINPQFNAKAGVITPRIKPKPPQRTAQSSGRSGMPAYVYKTNGGEKYPIDDRTYNAIMKVSEKTGIPPEAKLALCARESSCKPEAVNPSSGACGLTQLMTNHVETLYELTYKHAGKTDYGFAKDWVERYVRRTDDEGRPYFGYRPVDDTAKQNIISLCHDPEFNLTIWAADALPKIDKHKKWLGTNRELTPGELVVMNNIGQYGLQLFFGQVLSDIKTGKNTPARVFFEKHKRIFGNISTNKTLLYDESGKPLSVRASYNKLVSEHGGWGELKISRASLNL